MSKHPKRTWRRRAAALVAAGVTAAASLVVVALPAAAAPVSITNATFEWSVNTTMQNDWPFTGSGNCHYLSAGVSDGTDLTYHAIADDVAIAKGTATPSYDTRCTHTPGSPINQRVIWSGGTGTVDPTTGEATISFTGTLSVNWNGGASPFTIVDPVITVGTNGAASMVATMGGYASSQANPAIKTPIVPWTNVTVANMNGVASANTTGFTSTPLFKRVEVTVPVNGTPTALPPAATRTNPAPPNDTEWGSWPQSFVDFQYNASGLTSYFHSSGTNGSSAANVAKQPTAITVDYGLSSESDSMTIGVTVPEAVEPGEFVWSIDGDGQVVLSDGVNHADHWGYTGAIQPITVTDNRENAPEWSISGHVGDFTGSVDGKYLGWKPKVTGAGAGATPGAQVASGFISGNGLKTSSILASATAAHAGGTATIGADLDLRLPISTPAGSYSAILTITALS